MNLYLSQFCRSSDRQLSVTLSSTIRRAIDQYVIAAIFLHPVLKVETQRQLFYSICCSLHTYLVFAVEPTEHCFPSVVKIPDLVRCFLPLRLLVTPNLFYQHMRRLCWKLWVSLRDLNLFPSVPQSTNDTDIRIQRITTRLFISLFTFSIIILTVYTSSVNVKRTISVETLSFTLYSHLYSTYSQSLSCPCSQISISYEDIFEVQYTMHEVCNSAFVTDEWIDQLSPPYLGEVVLMPDFRGTAMNTFQALRAFCEISNRTISTGLTQFYSNQYVSATTTPIEIFHSQMETIFEKFSNSTTNELLLLLETVQDFTKVNVFWSGSLTNYLTVLYGAFSLFSTSIQTYDRCNCDLLEFCGDQQLIWVDLATLLTSLPGLYRGCLTTRALLQSTLQCFYDAACIAQLRSYFNTTSVTSVVPLRLSPSSRYQMNSTVQKMINKMMVEEWKWSAIYENYYNKCQPAMCTYTVVTRNDALYIVTTLFGLVGGLITILRICTPVLVKCGRTLIRWIMRRSTGMWVYSSVDVAQSTCYSDETRFRS